jgi:hypothetical protein
MNSAAVIRRWAEETSKFIDACGVPHRLLSRGIGKPGRLISRSRMDWPGIVAGRARTKGGAFGLPRAWRAAGIQCSGPDGVWLASLMTACEIRRQVVAPS